MLRRTVPLLLWMSATLAHAQALSIETIEHGPWPAAVAALQSQLRSQGQLVQVIVRDDTGRALACGTYTLNLDAAGASAFQIVGCDPANGSTALALVSRSALFAYDGTISRPLAIELSATEVRVGSIAGGAAVTGGSTLDCSVGIRPYLDDLEHGTHVELGPDRFEVRPRGAGIVVESQPQGWLLTAARSAQLVIDYDVVERATGQVVLSDRATLSCSSGAPAPLVTVVPAPTWSAPVPGADRILVMERMHTGRVAEVVGVVDVDEPYLDQTTALRMLRERAAALGADAIVGVRLHHDELDLPPAHLTGLAVRFRRAPGERR
jgi:hypothetical protein